MRIVFSRDFQKQYKKLAPAEQQRALKRLNLFCEDPLNPVLSNHKLRGEYGGLSSINITGDLRALYKPIKKDVALFIIIDTHSNLYD